MFSLKQVTRYMDKTGLSQHYDAIEVWLRMDGFKQTSAACNRSRGWYGVKGKCKRGKKTDDVEGIARNSAKQSIAGRKPKSNSVPKTTRPGITGGAIVLTKKVEGKSRGKKQTIADKFANDNASDSQVDSFVSEHLANARKQARSEGAADAIKNISGLGQITDVKERKKVEKAIEKDSKSMTDDQLHNKYGAKNAEIYAKSHRDWADVINGDIKSTKSEIDRVTASPRMSPESRQKKLDKLNKTLKTQTASRDESLDLAEEAASSGKEGTQKSLDVFRKDALNKVEKGVTDSHKSLGILGRELSKKGDKSLSEEYQKIGEESDKLRGGKKSEYADKRSREAVRSYLRDVKNGVAGLDKDSKKLGLSANPTKSELKDAYRKYSKENHPDRGGNADEFASVADAYNRLKTKHNFDSAYSPFDLYHNFLQRV